ncbi:MAG TPA: NAD-dependent epimerase/dehydratase family protein [Pseudonocardiaceae bacterium]
MRIVVIGGSGNVGTAVLRRLAASGGHELVGVSRRAPRPVEPYAAATWHGIDVSEPDSEDRLVAALRGADAVVHAAWLIQPAHDQNLLRRTNIEGTARIARAVVAAGVPHLVYLSSVGAYAAASKERRVDESWPTDGVPSSVYSRHKAAVEHLLDRLEGPVVTRLRPGLIMQRAAACEIARYFIGPLVPGLVYRAARDGKVPLLPLPSNFVVQFVHADDVARAVELAVLGRVGGAFNLAAEPPLGPRELAELVGARHVPVPGTLVRAAAAATWRLRLQPTAGGWVDLALAAPVMDVTQARDILGWTPTHTAQEAVRELIEGLAEGAGHPTSPVLRGHNGNGNNSHGSNGNGGNGNGGTDTGSGPPTAHGELAGAASPADPTGAAAPVNPGGTGGEDGR